jgi:hypothetical protein
LPKYSNIRNYSRNQRFLYILGYFSPKCELLFTANLYNYSRNQRFSYILWHFNPKISLQFTFTCCKRINTFVISTQHCLKLMKLIILPIFANLHNYSRNQRSSYILWHFNPKINLIFTCICWKHIHSLTNSNQHCFNSLHWLYNPNMKNYTIIPEISDFLTVCVIFTPK